MARSSSRALMRAAVAVFVGVGALFAAAPAHASPALEATYTTILDRSDNQRLAPGERAMLGVIVENKGSSDAHDVTVTLRDPVRMSILDAGPITFEDIRAGEERDSEYEEFRESEAELYFLIRIDDDVACPSVARGTYEISSDEGTWTDDVSLDVRCPIATIGDSWDGPLPVTDIASGETSREIRMDHPARISFELQNYGELDTGATTATLSSPDPAVVILDAEDEMDNIAAYGGQAVVSFDVTATRCGDGIPATIHLMGGSVEQRVERDTAFRVACPDFSVRPGLSIDDTATGDADGFPDPGETVAIGISIENKSSETIGDGRAVLTLDAITPAIDTVVVPTVRWLSTLGAGAFEIEIPSDAPSEIAEGCSFEVYADEDAPSPGEAGPITGTLTVAFAEGEERFWVTSGESCFAHGHAYFPTEEPHREASPPSRALPSRLAATGSNTWMVLSGVAWILAGSVVRRVSASTRRASSGLSAPRR